MNAPIKIQDRLKMDIRMSEQYQGFGDKMNMALETIFELAEGMPSFPDFKRCKLVKDDRVKPFLYLQDADDPELSFVCVDPFIMCSDYSVSLDKSVNEKVLNLRRPQDAIVLAIVIVGDDVCSTNANLLAPIILNTVNRSAAQIIMKDMDASYLKYNLWSSVENGSYKTPEIINEKVS